MSTMIAVAWAGAVIPPLFQDARGLERVRVERALFGLRGGLRTPVLREFQSGQLGYITPATRNSCAAGGWVEIPAGCPRQQGDWTPAYFCDAGDCGRRWFRPVVTPMQEVMPVRDPAPPIPGEEV